MNKETGITKFSITKLTAKQVIFAGYCRRGTDWIDANRFDFFKVGELKFDSLKVLKAHFGVKTLSQLEFEVDRLELGTIYADFYNVDSGYHWGAYLWNGSFRVGSSADRLVLAV
jgi:hypothetical protein